MRNEERLLLQRLLREAEQYHDPPDPDEVLRHAADRLVESMHGFSGAAQTLGRQFGMMAAGLTTSMDARQFLHASMHNPPADDQPRPLGVARLVERAPVGMEGRFRSVWHLDPPHPLQHAVGGKINRVAVYFGGPVGTVVSTNDPIHPEGLTALEACSEEEALAKFGSGYRAEGSDQIPLRTARFRDYLPLQMGAGGMYVFQASPPYLAGDRMPKTSCERFEVDYRPGDPELQRKTEVAVWAVGRDAFARWCVVGCIPGQGTAFFGTIEQAFAKIGYRCEMSPARTQLLAAAEYAADVFGDDDE